MSADASEGLTADFWRWALEQWNRPPIEASLMALQDQRGVIIMDVLLAAFLAFRGIAIRPEQWRNVVAVGTPWVTEVVVPLRLLRRRWKKDQDDGGLRAHLQRLELAAEKSLAVLYISALEAEIKTDSMGVARRTVHAGAGGVDRVAVLANLGLATAGRGVEAPMLEQLADLMVET